MAKKKSQQNLPEPPKHQFKISVTDDGRVVIEFNTSLNLMHMRVEHAVQFAEAIQRAATSAAFFLGGIKQAAKDKKNIILPGDQNGHGRIPRIVP